MSTEQKPHTPVSTKDVIFLDTTDVIEKPIQLTIKHVFRKGHFINQKGQIIDKIVIQVEETEKLFICNKTNRKRIVDYYTMSNDKWYGKKFWLGIGLANNPTLKQKVKVLSVPIPKDL
jgi:hypothetical protein